jgi:hypothetical protein
MHVSDSTVAAWPCRCTDLGWCGYGADKTRGELATCRYRRHHHRWFCRWFCRCLRPGWLSPGSEIFIRSWLVTQGFLLSPSGSGMFTNKSWVVTWGRGFLFSSSSVSLSSSSSEPDAIKLMTTGFLAFLLALLPAGGGLTTKTEGKVGSDTLQNETTQTGGAICVAHLCHVDLVRLNWGERLRQI